MKGTKGFIVILPEPDRNSPEPQPGKAAAVLRPAAGAGGEAAGASGLAAEYPRSAEQRRVPHRIRQRRASAARRFRWARESPLLPVTAAYPYCKYKIDGIARTIAIDSLDSDDKQHTR